MAASTEGPKGATPITEAKNRAVLDALPFGDTQDFEDARRRFLGSLPEVEIANEQAGWSGASGATRSSRAKRRRRR